MLQFLPNNWSILEAVYAVLPLIITRKLKSLEFTFFPSIFNSTAQNKQANKKQKQNKTNTENEIMSINLLNKINTQKWYITGR